MSLDIHVTAFVNGGANLQRTDRVLTGFYPGIAYPAGAGAGAAVVLPFTAKGFGTKFHVDVTPDQDMTWFVTKTGPGQFTLTLNPRLATATLNAGSLDIRVRA